jgi:DNA-binding IclR family transcriptional regulator
VAFEPGQAIIAVLYAEPGLTVDVIVERLGGQLDRAAVEAELETLRSQGATRVNVEGWWSLTPDVGG